MKKIQLIQDDPWLEPYQQELSQRIQYFTDRLQSVTKKYGSLQKYASAHDYLGFNYDKKSKGWWYREWAPAAKKIHLIGEFNNWEENTPLKKDKKTGIWEVFVKNIESGTRVKVRIQGADGKSNDRIPALIKRAIQDEKTHDFSGQIWHQPPFKWSDSKFDIQTLSQPLIYEAHIGMAQEKEGVGTYDEFTQNILPRIHQLGYNCIQLMAIQEHPYYGSFGYHVSNYFAPTSRFGTPESLKNLINEAHKLGIAVIMDAVYSHSVKNTAEGINNFDGSEHQYFHEGGRGYHTSWDSKLFNYGKEEVMQFLLSNIKYWIEEFHFDGFRFDGVTSMLYEHHGDHISFDHYDKYFKHQVDWDAILFLQLANTLTHEIKPGALTIAEDMSGMPGMCRLPEHGGIGFDYRLGMGIPDYWIKILKHTRDEDWDIHAIWNVLSNRRWKEKTIAYAESHDQALVGDKTLAFWLMDKEMYWHMSKDDPKIEIERGIALLKLIKLITASSGGEGYLNFIGNEFGHPEWVDFPREGNNWSYKYARRQWSLVDNPDLKYQFLYAFEKAMLTLLKKHHILDALPAQALNMDTTNNVIIFERNNLVFIFNFHPVHSIPDYALYVPKKGQYKIILNSDSTEFGGLNRIDSTLTYPTRTNENGGNELKIYLTNRTALVLKKK